MEARDRRGRAVRAHASSDAPRLRNDGRERLEAREGLVGASALERGARDAALERRAPRAARRSDRGRKRVAEFVRDESEFCFTYGDGLADVDISAQIAFHRGHGRLATITAVQPPGRYGALLRRGDEVVGFKEKPPGDGAWINGGFFVLSPEVLDDIEGDRTSWEGAPLEALAGRGQLAAYEHRGFWLAMDTLRDKNQLEQLWNSGAAPWKCWD